MHSMLADRKVIARLLKMKDRPVPSIVTQYIKTLARTITASLAARTPVSGMNPREVRRGRQMDCRQNRSGTT